MENVVTGSTLGQVMTSALPVENVIPEVLKLPLKLTSAAEDIILEFTPQLPLLSYAADVLLMDGEYLGLI